MSKHTKGPWATTTNVEGNVFLHRAPIRSATDWFAYLPLTPATENLEANAARIVACVNACEGIEDPSVVPDILKIIRDAERARYCGIPHTGIGDMAKLVALLARAEGRK